jgi:hypothetical protein
MIINFFGLSGAGKTYYSIKSFIDHKYKVIKINNRFEKYFFVFIFFFIHPVSSVFLIKATISENINNKRLLIYKIKHLLFLVLARQGKSSFYGDVVVDDGLFQFLLIIFERKISYNDLAPFRNFLKDKKTIAYIVEANRETRLARMEKRNRFPRRSIFGKEYFYKWLEVEEYNYIIIKEFIMKNFDYKIINNN